jgi:hypothetical protein
MGLKNAKCQVLPACAVRSDWGKGFRYSNLIIIILIFVKMLCILIQLNGKRATTGPAE